MVQHYCLIHPFAFSSLMVQLLFLLSENYSELMRHFPTVSEHRHSGLKMVVLMRISQMNNNYNIFLSKQTLRKFLIKFIHIIINILNTFVLVRVSGRIDYFDILSTFWQKMWNAFKYFPKLLLKQILWLQIHII